MSPPRILKITVRSARNNRLARVYAKVPYGAAYFLTEQLTRALMTNEILWFRLEPAKATEITTGVRRELKRWPEALRSMSERTGIDWLT